MRPAWLAAFPGETSLIEPGLGSSPGVPDCWAAILLDHGWVEFKAVSPEGIFILEPTQKLWLRRNLTQFRAVAFVIMDDEGFWTVSGVKVLAYLLEHGGLNVNVYAVAGRKVSWEVAKQNEGAVLLARLRLAWEGKA